MYQPDMMDEEDSCGGLDQRPRAHRPQRRLKNSRPAGSVHEIAPDRMDYIDHERRHHEGQVDGIYYPQKKAAADEAKSRAKARVEPLEQKQHIHDLFHIGSRIVTIGKAIPWRKNGSRTIARPFGSHYGVYIHEVHVTDTNVKVKLMALGEWNMTSPKASLFCVTAEGETWDELAQEEHELAKVHKKYYPSRFDRAEWHPANTTGTSAKTQGYYEGTLILPLSFLETSLKQPLTATKATLNMRYAATAPWHDEYAVMDLLVFDATTSGGTHMTCQCTSRTKLPVPVHEAWKAIFPPDVFERFRSRESKY